MVSPVLLFLILSSTVVVAYFAQNAISLFRCVRATSVRGIKLRHEGYTKPKSISIREHHRQCRFPSLNILNFILRNVRFEQIAPIETLLSASGFFSLTRSSCPRCPIDGKNIAKNTSFLDKCCEREVLNLQCCCRYEDRKCDWRGSFREVQVNSFRPNITIQPRRSKT